MYTAIEKPQLDKENKSKEEEREGWESGPTSESMERYKLKTQQIAHVLVLLLAKQ